MRHAPGVARAEIGDEIVELAAMIDREHGQVVMLAVTVAGPMKLLQGRAVAQPVWPVPAGEERFRVSAKGPRTLIPSGAEELLLGTPAEGVDARGIQPFYTGLLARLTNMAITIGIENEEFVFTATPEAPPAAVDAA